MVQPIQKKITLAFLLLAMMDIVGILIQSEWMHYIAKPLLIPALLILMYFTNSPLPGKKILMTGTTEQIARGSQAWDNVRGEVVGSLMKKAINICNT